MNRTYAIVGLAVVLIAALATYAIWQPTGQQPRYDRVLQTSTTTPDAATTTPDTQQTPAPVSSQYGMVTIALNQVASYPDGLSLRPLAVTEDSRCPQGARCAQKGRVVLSVRIRSGSGVAVHDFEPGTTITTEVQTVTLLSVEPNTRTDETIAPGDYRLTFEVLRRNVPGAGDGCYVGGCSSQLCTDDPNSVSTCEYRAEYACYLAARCERQSSGACGWTPTPAFTSCIANPPPIE